MQYYRFKAIIAGEQKVGKKSLLSKIDQGHEENRIVLVDKISQTLFVFEFIRTYEYQPDALFYLYIYDQTNEKTFTTIQEKLMKLNIDKSFQFIVLICNKCDLTSQIQYDIEHYATQNQFIYIQVSALTGKNITLLQNILRIKTAQTMKKCKIQPIKMDSLQNSPKLSERPLPKTPKTPTTPQTPESYDTECKSIQSEVVNLEDMEPQIDIGIKRIQNSIKKLNEKIENKLDSTIRIYRQQSPKYSQRVPVIDLDTTSRSKSREDSKNKFPDHLNPRVYGRNLKPLLTISFQIDSIQDIIDIDVYQDDTIQLITDRLQVQCGLKFNQVQKKLVQQVIDQKLASFREELQRVVANSQRRNLKIKEQVENFITYFNHDHKVELQKFQQNRLKKSAQGELIVTVDDKVFELFIFPNMDAYETGFQAILDFGLKKNMIEKLVSRIQIIQNTKTIRTLCMFDFIDMELIIYQGENIHKYLQLLIQQEKYINILPRIIQIMINIYLLKICFDQNIKKQNKLTDMSRMLTCGNECLDYENDYESILVVKNIPPTTRASKAQQLSLQFYSRPVQQKKSESFLIRKSPYGQLFKTSPIQQKIQPLSQKVTPLIKQSPAMIKIKQMVQLQKINQISSFKKLVF